MDLKNLESEREKKNLQIAEEIGQHLQKRFEDEEKILKFIAQTLKDHLKWCRRDLFKRRTNW